MKQNYLMIIAVVFALAASAQKQHYLLVGTYTSGKSEGIYVFDFDNEDGTATKLSSLYSSNPSFISVSPDGKHVFAVNENDPGQVSSFSFDKSTGRLTQTGQLPSGGAHPCYIATDKSGKWVVAGNYSGGNLSLYSVKDGKLKGPLQTINHEGSSVNLDRQEGPHVHATVFSPDGRYVYVPDLGIDKVMIYSLNAKKEQLEEASTPFVMVEPGAGPRHFEFHPNGRYAYLVEELTGTISVYAAGDRGALELLQNIPALPYDYTGPIGSADIHVSPDGKFLYASNRGDANNIAIFIIDQKTGLLTIVGHQPVLGIKPRNFNVDPSGNFLLVANQDSDEIVVFRRDRQSGLLEDTGSRITVPSPVCIKWVPK